MSEPSPSQAAPLMASLSTHVTDAEFSILEALWDQGPSTVRQIAERLHQKPTHSAQASIDKLIQRLESKSLVRRNRESIPHIVEAVRARDELVGQQLRQVADRLSGGSIAPLIMQMISDRQLSKSERSKLRELLDEDETK